MGSVWWVVTVIVGSVWLAGCVTRPMPVSTAVPAPKPVPIAAPVAEPAAAAPVAAVTAAAPTINRAASRWVPVPWSDLPGWNADSLGGA